MTVEFAICFPLLLLFFFAAFEFCRANMIRQTADNAAYEGARRAIVPGATAEDARAAGASWRRIGEALGIAAQSAHKRFDPRARRRHAEYMRARYRPAEEEL